MSTNNSLDQNAVYIKSSQGKSKHRPQVRLDGPYGYVSFGTFEIGHHAGELAATLRLLADQLEPKIGRRRAYAIQNQIPDELADPETAWPFLVNRFPWLFDSIETGTEPYAQYLKESQLQQDLDRVADLGPEPALADLAERLYSERSYGGSRYKYLKKLQNRLKSTSTPRRQGDRDESNLKRAA